MNTDALLEVVREQLAPYSGQKFLIAVSGGVDSVSLLDLLLRLQAELKLKLLVAHADHGLRRGSARDARFVRELAASYSLPFVETKLQLAPGANQEARARDARYAWLESVRRRRADYIVTAHQADDQVETLFLHLARGSGLAGLSGMADESHRILRPLLDVPRKDLARYARRRKLSHRIDPTNKSLRIARNRVRRQVITSLQRINPQLIETVSQSMRVLADEHSVLQQLATRELAKAVQRQTADRLELALPRLRRLRRGLRHLVWREALRSFAGDLAGFRLAHLENLDDLLSRQTGSTAHLPRNILAVRQYDHLVLRRQSAKILRPSRTTLAIPGSVVFGDRKLTARRLRGRAPQPSPQRIIVDGRLTSLVVRPPKVGDRFRPAGMRGSKLVSDLLTDAKLPREERPWVPVVATPADDIIWVAGWRADRRFAAQAGSRRLLLTLE